MSVSAILFQGDIWATSHCFLSIQVSWCCFHSLCYWNIEHILIDFLHSGRNSAKTQSKVRTHCTSPASLAIEKKAESLLARSLVGESASTRFPSERTTIRSLSMMVLSLCAMVMIVQCRNSFRIVAWIRSSVSKSIAAVASSKTITLLCLRHARAKQRSCLWPTERLSPPSLIGCSRPPGKLATSVKQCYIFGKSLFEAYMI